jgi:hypothetical protein
MMMLRARSPLDSSTLSTLTAKAIARSFRVTGSDAPLLVRGHASLIKLDRHNAQHVFPVGLVFKGSRAAPVWRLERFIDERLPPLTEVALAAVALAELRHGQRNVGVETLKRLLRRG